MVDTKKEYQNLTQIFQKSKYNLLLWVNLRLLNTLGKFVLVLYPLCISAQNKDSIALKYANFISTEDLKKNLTIIASDEYEGRETGKRGQKMAADYIADQFKTEGIPALKHNGYFQPFLLNEKQPGEIKIFIQGKEFKANKDYYSFSGDIKTKRNKIKVNELTFLGYGIEEKNYNDYAGVSVKNKTVLIFSGDPQDKDSLSLITKEINKSYWNDKQKIKHAGEKGVKTVLIVKEDIVKEVARNKQKLESPSMALKSEKHCTSVIYISKQMADSMLSGTSSVDKLKKEISLTQKPISINANKHLKITVKSKDQQISSENVLGYIEGRDLKNEVIVISAHYDHLGIRDNKVYNGADDDGSGTVALMELAKVFAKAKKEGHGARRSLLFIAFSGEEKGLLGSLYYSDHPEFPLSQTVCDLNIDMIGRIDEKHDNNADYVYLIGSDKLSSQLHNISENTNKIYTNLQLDYTYNDEKDKNRFYYRSDHYNFAKNGVPVIFYFNGVHDDYHQETDEVKKINFEKIKKISSLVFFTAWELANREERIKVDSNKK
jgi:hypothetical protein